MKEPMYEPETKTAFLYCDGAGRFTRHDYVRARKVVLPTPVDADAGPGGDALELIYKCSETGAERRWGVVEAK